jgi:transposase
MSNEVPPNLDIKELKKLSKTTLIRITLEHQETLNSQIATLNEKEKKITELTEQLVKLSKDSDEQKNKEVNKTVNQPSSKKPEWDKDGNPKSSKGAASNNKKPKRKKRPGCGNPSKSDLIPDAVHHTELNACQQCGTNLKGRPGTLKPSRIVEDIQPPPEKTLITEEIEETKWCPRCKKIVSSKTQSALPGSDYGLSATIEIAYLWVMSAMSLPNIKSFFQSFKTLKISTAGISKMMIRLSKILEPVYEGILNDVKQGTEIWADETGWRTGGKLWWLWIFANKRSAYYWPDQSRGSQVVEQVLGPIFYGILMVDGWHAYNKLVCDRQTCMAHIFRKIRAFIDAYPQYRSIMQFYLRLRQIIRDGEKLQAQRPEISELSFKRRLKKLKQRLHDLLAWKNPNVILADTIKKVRRQENHVLTFVEHSGGEHHNNYGEYIIKKGVLKRKVSGGSKSAEGVHAYAIIQSIAMTCQLRQVSFCHFMRKSLVQYIRTGKPMLLEEYEALFTMKSKAA